MSFQGEFGLFAEKAANDLAPVLEVTLNAGGWNGGVLMHLSDRACSARGNAYDPRVVAGGWTGVRSQIDVRASGLGTMSTSVTVADIDNKVRNALAYGDQRYSPAQIYRVVPGSVDDYHQRFGGILDTWEFLPGQVKLNFKTDDRALRSYQPRWVYLDSEWFHMSLDFKGAYIPLLYGKHDSSGLNLGRGILPTVPVWKDATSAWYGIHLGPGCFVKAVFVDGVDQGPSGGAWSPVFGSLAGGKVVTIIIFTSPGSIADDAVVTVDAYGYAEPPQAAFGGEAPGAVITNPVTQLRNFVINYGIERSRGYLFSWSMTNDLIESTSWDAAATFADQNGLEGSRLLKNQQTVLDTIREWCDSFPMFKPYWTNEGKIAMRILTTQWPGYWNGTSAVIRRPDDLDNSFRYQTDATDVTGKISVKYLLDSVDDKYMRTLDVHDPTNGELSDSSMEMPWQPARQV